jgi:polyisoprenoid-binding protein YceI
MMKKRIIGTTLLIFISCCIALSQSWQAVTYNVSFKIKNAGITVSGKFTGLKANLVFNPDKLATSSLKASVEVATIKTGINKRDEDLQGEKYFNTDKYKLIEVASTKLYKKGAQYAGTFNVTIKGVTKSVEIPFDFKQTGNEATFTGSFPLNRRDFGVGGRTLTMSDDLTVSIEITAKK